MRRRCLPLLGLLALAACKREDMYTQDKYYSWDRDNFFPKQQSMLKPVPGTVARAQVDLPVAQPRTITQAMVERGHQRFDIFCKPCHGRSGDGHGMIVQRGFPQPPSFYSSRLRQARASLYYDTITDGHGAMYSYADRVPSADRWAITAYIRALQLSQDAQVASLPEQDKAQLGTGP